jgi:hypothetical protein
VVGVGKIVKISNGLTVSDRGGGVGRQAAYWNVISKV